MRFVRLATTLLKCDESAVRLFTPLRACVLETELAYSHRRGRRDTDRTALSSVAWRLAV